MESSHRIKRFLFNCYAPISAGVIIIAFFLLLIQYVEWSLFAAIAVGVFAFAFGVQKQILEEMKLFKELFEQFNERYDKINDDMNRIRQQPFDLPLKEDEIRTLYKYFNLCAEEWLYTKKGFICKEVWRAWTNGMKFFRQNPRIQKLWDEELGNNSYYGLKF
jgi:hypothetical protein